MRLEVHAAGKLHSNPAKRQAKRGTKDNLLRDEHGQVDGLAQCQGAKHGSEHVGERVVGARLDLEQRVGATLERKPVLAQDGENACGVGGRDDGAQKERQRPIKAQGNMGKHRGEAGGDHYACGGEQDGGGGHRACTLDVGVKATVEHDEDKGCGTDALGCLEVVKVDMQRPAASQEHAEGDKDEQRGEGKFGCDGLE